jgi:hypothetical protein
MSEKINLEQVLEIIQMDVRQFTDFIQTSNGLFPLPLELTGDMSWDRRDIVMWYEVFQKTGAICLGDMVSVATELEQVKIHAAKLADDLSRKDEILAHYRAEVDSLRLDKERLNNENNQLLLLLRMHGIDTESGVRIPPGGAMNDPEEVNTKLQFQQVWNAIQHVTALVEDHIQQKSHTKKVAATPPFFQQPAYQQPTSHTSGYIDNWPYVPVNGFSQRSQLTWEMMGQRNIVTMEEVQWLRKYFAHVPVMGVDPSSSPEAFAEWWEREQRTQTYHDNFQVSLFTRILNGFKSLTFYGQPPVGQGRMMQQR